MSNTFHSIFPARRTGLVQLTGGGLLSVGTSPQGLRAWFSKDDGRTWPQQLDLGIEARQVSGLVRLNSGPISLTYEAPFDAGAFGVLTTTYLRTSRDDGRTWSGPSMVHFPQPGGGPYHDTLIQMRSGRLVQPGRACFAADKSKMNPAMARIAGKDFNIEGHAHYPEIDLAYADYSDDEGATWRRCEGSMFVWLDGGQRGAYACDEPTVAEASDGRLVMFARSTIGRIVELWSEDGGRTWSNATANALANSYSPARIRSIPDTAGHLHAVWNQVSADEIRRGFRRSRLCSAISIDGGKSWRNFKTLDCCSSIDPRPQVELEEPPSFAIARQHVGEFPADYSIFRYPNVCYAGGSAYIMYDRESAAEKTHYQRILRAFPIEMLYREDPWDLRLSNAIAAPRPAETIEQTAHIEV